MIDLFTFFIFLFNYLFISFPKKNWKVFIHRSVTERIQILLGQYDCTHYLLPDYFYFQQEDVMIKEI